jgi:hypothetical protein
MKKTYIAPETELIVTHSENLLQNISNQTGQDVVTKEPVVTPGEGGNNDDAGARQHNNWMWDTMEDEF